MNYEGAKERFFDFHPQLNTACRMVAKEVSGDKSYQPKHNKLKTEVWNSLDALTMAFYAIVNGKTLDPKGLFLAPSM
jgi:hypothetical protein